MFFKKYFKSLVLAVIFLFTISAFLSAAVKHKEKNRKIKIFVSLGANFLRPGPNVNYDYRWSIFDDEYTHGKVRAHTYSAEVCEKSLYGGTGIIGVTLFSKIGGIEIYGGYSQNVVKQKGVISFRISNMKELPSVSPLPLPGYPNVDPFYKTVYSETSGVSDYTIKQSQIDLGIAYHFPISIFQPYVGLGLSRVNISAEIPEEFYFKDWYEGHLGRRRVRKDGCLYSWPVFVADDYSVKLRTDPANKLEVETKIEKGNRNLLHYRIGFNLWLNKNKSFALFGEATHISKISLADTFKLKASGSELIYYQKRAKKIFGRVGDKRVYSPKDSGVFKMQFGGWKLVAGIKIGF